MEIISEVKRLIRKTLIEDSTIYSLVSSNVRQSHIRTIENPTYPIICISFEPVGTIEHQIKELRTKPIEIVPYSQKSSEESNRIGEKIIDILHKNRISTSDIAVVLYANSDPSDIYIEEDRLFASPISFTCKILKL